MNFVGAGRCLSAAFWWVSWVIPPASSPVALSQIHKTGISGRCPEGCFLFCCWKNTDNDIAEFLKTRLHRCGSPWAPRREAVNNNICVYTTNGDQLTTQNLDLAPPYPFWLKLKPVWRYTRCMHLCSPVSPGSKRVRAIAKRNPIGCSEIHPLVWGIYIYIYIYMHPPAMALLISGGPPKRRRLPSRWNLGRRGS